jgi:hypothetical protein
MRDSPTTQLVLARSYKAPVGHASYLPPIDSRAIWSDDSVRNLMLKYPQLLNKEALIGKTKFSNWGHPSSVL